VPYGKGNAAVELLGGRIDAALQWPSVFQSHVEAGNLSMLAVTSAERLETLADLPSANEQGVDVDLVLWRGLAAPAETPPEVVNTLAQAVEQVVTGEQFEEAAQRIGCQPAYLAPDEFASFITQKDEEIAALMDELEIKKQ
jgi:tripartite-type tricarboxylate transporter receptor subunit TctC